MSEYLAFFFFHMVITNLGSFFFSFSLIMHMYTLFMHNLFSLFFQSLFVWTHNFTAVFSRGKKRFTTCCFGYTFHTAKSTCSFPLSRHSTTWRASPHSQFGHYFCSNLYGSAPRGSRGVKKSDFFFAN